MLFKPSLPTLQDDRKRTRRKIMALMVLSIILDTIMLVAVTLTGTLAGGSWWFGGMSGGIMFVYSIWVHAYESYRARVWYRP